MWASTKTKLSLSLGKKYIPIYIYKIPTPQRISKTTYYQQPKNNTTKHIPKSPDQQKKKKNIMGKNTSIPINGAPPITGPQYCRNDLYHTQSYEGKNFPKQVARATPLTLAREEKTKKCKKKKKTSALLQKHVLAAKVDSKDGASI